MSLSCQYCNFNCVKQSDWERHLKTKKHSIYAKSEQKRAKSKLACRRCKKEYTVRSSLWYHEQKCESSQKCEQTPNRDGGPD